MKLNSAFKLSALAVALASTSTVFAATLDSSTFNNDAWTDPRTVSNIADTSSYQYVDVGSKTTKTLGAVNPGASNKLTELYKLDGDNKFLLKISPVGSATETEALIYEFDQVAFAAEVETALGKSLNAATATEIADLFKSGGAFENNPVYQFDKLKLYGKQLVTTPIPPTAVLIAAGTTKDTVKIDKSVSDIKRLDTKFLEYADSVLEETTLTPAQGNLTHDDTGVPKVVASVAGTASDPIKTLVSDRGVITGILNEKAVSDSGFPINVLDREYGVLVHSTQKKITDLKDEHTFTQTDIEKSTKITEGKIVLKSETEVNKSTANYDDSGKIVAGNEKNVVQSELTSAETIISAEGIVTGSLKVNGVDVGAALTNTAALGNISQAELNTILNAGATITALDGRVEAVETKLDNEVSRLDGRINNELASNAQQSTTYTNDQVAAEKLAREGADTALSNRIDTEATARSNEDALLSGRITAEATARVNADTALSDRIDSFNDSISNLNNRANQLNSRISDVEKTAYRGVAIALAAQQQIPNIQPGQFALFGGVGHYEGESAAALGVASVFADGRTSVSAALGLAGSSAVGGRVGVSYVFGGK